MLRRHVRLVLFIGLSAVGAYVLGRRHPGTPSLPEGSHTFAMKVGAPAIFRVAQPSEPPTREEPALPPDGLARLSLPGDLVRAGQWATVEATLQDAVARVSRARASTVQRFEALREWLSTQGCIERVNVPIREGGGVNALLILTTDPALVPISIVFRTEVKPRVFSRLLLAVDAPAGLRYVGLRREEQ